MATAHARSGGKAEIRFELPVEEVGVIDGYCQARGLDRTTVFRELLKVWSDEKLHEAVLICRVARVNPMQPETNRGT